MHHEIVLTADRGTFTDYNRSTALGYIADMPARLVPRLFMDKFFTPPVPADREGKALYAPYTLRKVEAALIKAGYQDVIVTPPERLERVVGPRTKVVGISVHDIGLSPVGTLLAMILGGGETWTGRFFRELGDKVAALKRKYGFRVILGGPGVEQVIRAGRPEWVDAIFLEDAEITLPKWLPRIIAGEEVPPVIRPSLNEYPSVEDIPVIVNPARLGEVQITRGCPRGCQFCPVTPTMFRSIPVEHVVREVEVNLRAGWTQVDLITDDVLLYGTSPFGPNRLRVNHDAIVKLFSAIRSLRAGDLKVEHIFFSHTSIAPVVESPKTVRAIAELGGYGPDKGDTPVIGLETGSVRILAKYMRNKAYPFPPEKWHELAIESAIILNENYIYPAYTMMVGFPEENVSDLMQTLALVEKFIDHDLTVWIFPLPVIPMYTTALRHLRQPEKRHMPDAFWDITYVSWRYNLRVTRRLVPILLQNVRSRLVRGVVSRMIDRVFASIEWLFDELRRTRGEFSERLARINLDTAFGALKAVYWLVRVLFRFRN